MRFLGGVALFNSYIGINGEDNKKVSRARTAAGSVKSFLSNRLLSVKVWAVLP
jgi:hypothetical protein